MLLENEANLRMSLLKRMELDSLANLISIGILEMDKDDSAHGGPSLAGMETNRPRLLR